MLDGSSPVTAAGPCRIHTGFPILPTVAGGAPRIMLLPRAGYTGEAEGAASGTAARSNA
jgi:hypothetical protein